MSKISTKTLGEAITHFHPPSYEELPDMGLYLDQTTKYVNQCLKPLGCVTVTSTMIRNYVKMGLLKNPIKKLYMREHIAHLLCIALLKSVVSMDQISSFFAMQERLYTKETAYNYFFAEFLNLLFYRFGLKEEAEILGQSATLEKDMLYSAITAMVNIIYLNACFNTINAQDATITKV